jgi:protein phosphatase 1 regulatory subunit 7
LTRLEGLEELVNLEELYVSHNLIEKLEGLENNTKLRTLDIANNRVSKLENISHLKLLEEFWV